MGGINEWIIASYLCIFITIILIIIILLSIAWQYLWAWIDDSKKKNNQLIKILLNLNKWKYPVYNGQYSPDTKIFGYAKDKNFKNSSVHGLSEGKDYIYSFRRNNFIFLFFILVCIFICLLPIILLLMFKLYSITISVLIIIGMSFLARFLRRLSKKYKGHVSNKKIHN